MFHNCITNSEIINNGIEECPIFLNSTFALFEETIILNLLICFGVGLDEKDDWSPGKVANHNFIFF